MEHAEIQGMQIRARENQLAVPFCAGSEIPAKSLGQFTAPDVRNIFYLLSWVGEFPRAGQAWASGPIHSLFNIRFKTRAQVEATQAPEASPAADRARRGCFWAAKICLRDI